MFRLGRNVPFPYGATMLAALAHRTAGSSRAGTSLSPWAGRPVGLPAIFQSMVVTWPRVMLALGR